MVTLFSSVQLLNDQVKLDVAGRESWPAWIKLHLLVLHIHRTPGRITTPLKTDPLLYIYRKPVRNKCMERYGDR